MASLSIRSGGNRPLLNRNPLNHAHSHNQNARSCSLPIVNRLKSRRRRGISMSTAPAAQCRPHLEPLGKREGINNEAIGHDKIDEWMRESVVEIVKNLREAPLLVLVYSKNGGSTRLKTEKANMVEWPIIKGKWKDGERPLPDGVIFVEELKDDDEDDGASEEDDGYGVERGITKAWGVVIQGKGAECGPACYLLKTSRVRSILGSSCTHFCLMKVKNFRESAQSQLTNCWLLQPSVRGIEL